MVTTSRELMGMEAECDGNHEHAAWGPKVVGGRFVGFCTEDEAEYTPEFCSAYARAAVHKLG